MWLARHAFADRVRALRGFVRAAVAWIVVGAVAAAGANSGATSRVLLTKGEALRVVFPECEAALEVRRVLGREEKEAIERALRRPLEEKGFLLYLGLRRGEIDGFAVISNEIGKTEPITFIVGANRDGTVRRVAVMVYRESHGGEVQARRFLAQFERKSRADPIELHRDVINVSGATLSATALCNGTRKVLAALDQVCLHVDAKELLAQARAGGAREIVLEQRTARDEPEGPEEREEPGESDEIGPAGRSVAADRSALEGCRLVEARRLVMGSELRVVARSPAADALERVHAALDEADRLDAVLSDWRDDSELARVNRDAARGPVAVGPTMLAFLQESALLSRLTGGAFDPGIGEQVRAWGFRDGRVRRPDDAELRELVAGSGLSGVEIDAAARTVRFTRPRVRLDPGAIGKGMAVDAIVAALRASGIDDALVDFGSTQRALGPGPGPGPGPGLGPGPGIIGLGWPVAIRRASEPGSSGERDEVVEVVFLRDEALSTSGGDRKFVELDGERLPHILDPRTARPARGCASATVIASTGARADALSTALFVLGEAGATMIEAIPDAAGRIDPLLDRHDAAPIRTSRWLARTGRLAAR